jgi:hypothetical protein
MSDLLYMLSAQIEVISLDTQSFESHHVILSQFCFCIVACDIIIIKYLIVNVFICKS